MSKQDQKDGRRQAGRVVIFLLTPALPESLLGSPCIRPQSRRFYCPHPCPRQPPYLTRAAFNHRQVQEVNSNPSQGHGSHPGAFRPVTDISCLLVTHVGSWVPDTCLSAATAKSLQPCPTLCDPINSSPPGSPVPGILQARTLEWVAISFSNA